MFVILLIMGSSWIEPILFLAVTGVAVMLNPGTNIFLGRISEVSSSIGPLLRMILSMDYGIMLLSRYRQELAQTNDKPAAMKTALQKAFASVTASSVTTAAGLLCLCLMSFKNGMAALPEMKAEDIKIIYAYDDDLESYSISLDELINYAADDPANGEYKNKINKTRLKDLQKAQKIIAATKSGEQLTPAGMGGIPGMEAEDLKTIYSYNSYCFAPDSYRAGLVDMVNFLLTDGAEHPDGRDG
jgi:hypothetical protein